MAAYCGTILRGPRVGLLVLLAGLSGCSAAAGTATEPIVRARPVPLHSERPEVVEAGRLRFENGFVLDSSDPRFGGFSALWIAGDGSRLLAASDRGTLWSADLRHTDSGQLDGFGGWSVATPGRHPDDPRKRPNIEALAPDGAGGLVMAMEGAHRLRRYPGDDFGAVPEALAIPSALEQPGNQGIEALADLPDGALLALSEGLPAEGGGTIGWRLRNGGIDALRYVAPAGFAPTGADRLDDTIFVVERRLSLLGLQARVGAFPVDDVRPGARIETQELARLVHPLVTDNFEAIAARRGPDGRVLLYILSDDNFIALQRTYLLQFSLMPAGSGAAAGDGVGGPHEGPKRQE